MRSVKKVEFAEVQGFTKSYVSKLLRRGIIKAESNGRLDLVKCSRQLIEYRNRPRRKISKVALENLDFGDLIGSCSCI